MLCREDIRQKVTFLSFLVEFFIVRVFFHFCPKIFPFIFKHRNLIVSRHRVHLSIEEGGNNVIHSKRTSNVKTEMDEASKREKVSSQNLIKVSDNEVKVSAELRGKRNIPFFMGREQDALLSLSSWTSLSFFVS